MLRDALKPELQPNTAGPELDARRMRLLLESIGEGVCELDREGRCTYVNPSGAALLGYRPHEIIGRDLHELAHSRRADGSDYPREECPIERSIISGKQCTVESEVFWHRDGHALPVEYSAHPIVEAGVITGAVVTFMEISGRKRAEKVLMESERRFREMLANVELIAIILDSEGIVTFCNDYLLRLTGWTREEVVGESWFPKFIPPEERRVMDLFSQTIRDGAVPRHFQNRIQTRQGDRRHIEWNNTILRSSSGRITGIASIGQDVTDWKRAEEELRESELRFRQLAENINGVFWITDPGKNEILYISPGYATIWGRPCDHVYRSPRGWLEAIHEEDRDRVLEAALTKQARGEYDETYRIVRPDGALRWIHDRAFPLRNESGVYRIVGIAEDITERKQLEAQFRHAQKMECIGQLAGGVAHDFNNILTVIQGHASMMDAEETLSADGRGSLREIALSAERAAGLTRQLLTFSRRQVMQPSLGDLNCIVRGITRMLRRLVGDDVAVRFESSAEPIMVMADPGMIEQVLMNLAVNARDAMPRGGSVMIGSKTIEVDTSMAERFPESIPGRYACLTVADEGCGIDPDNLSRIFEPFFTTKEVGKGTGLGLATVYGIVSQHQGWITVESEANRGTTFGIYLPIAAGVAGAMQMDSPLEDAIPSGTETILLVEDSAPLREMVKRSLSASGYTVIEAACGSSALDAWREHGGKIDLLLTDMVMPGNINGRELADALRKERRQLPVIYSSGYSAEFTAADFPLRDGVNFLQKPYTPRKMARCVRDQLDAAARLNRKS